MQNTINQRANPLGRARKFDAHELHLMLVGLLAEGSRHGYELRKALETLSGGFYSPSPGVLYPALARLQEQGHAQMQVQGNRKCYHLSAAGQQYLQAHQPAVEHLFAVLRHAARKMVWMREASVDEALASAETGWLPEFVAVRRQLRQSLLAYSDAPHTEQRRVVAILQQALLDIGAPKNKAMLPDIKAAANPSIPLSPTQRKTP